MKKRAISALMAATMVWGVVSVPALAATDAENENKTQDVTTNDHAGGQHAAIGGVDTKEHKEHFRVVVPVDKNIYTFTVDPEMNGKLTAAVNTERTVYFERTNNQEWWKSILPKDDVEGINNGWFLSNKSDFIVVTNIGSTNVTVSADATSITANTQSILDVGLDTWVNGPVKAAYDVNDNGVWRNITDHTRYVVDDVLIDGVRSNGVFYPASMSVLLPREGGHTHQKNDDPVSADNLREDTTNGYLSWKVEDKTTYFEDATKDIKATDRTEANLSLVNSAAFQVVAESTGKGWSENQQARIMVVWNVQSDNAILPHVASTKIKVADWSKEQNIPINLGEGSLKATDIEAVYMVYGRDNNEMRLDTEGDLWCKGYGPVAGTDVNLTITETAMKSIASANEADPGSWIPVMFKIVYRLQDNKTSESYVWFY